jgi:transcriptional regulator with GAF, ATPase, and Fis domain
VALDYFIEISGAERGMVTCFDEDGEPSFEATWNLPGEGLAHPDFEISRKIIAKVKSAREPICLCHALEAPAPEKSHSTPRLKTLSVICLPLCHERKIFGIVYLDNRTISGAFTPEKFRLIRSFADFVSLAACCALQAKRQQNRVYALEAELRARCDFEAIVGHHPRLLEILKLVAQIADTDATVLIQGESGTGKELIARALHCNSRRQHHPFVPINCGALPENLLESELFGHVRGAFTGAVKNKLGWFERANGGTIFLDEISKMTPALQAKLLRVLQTGEYSPVGSAEIRHCDVRILAATNKDLQELINAGAFQEDLYYRLNVIDIMLPPLRDRRSDIPVLIQHFLRSLSEKYRKENTDNSQIESIISEKNVDILLLEVLSQNASEIEMIKTVRNRCPDTEIILIDGDADRDLIAAAFSYGIRDAFRKPYNRVLIVERVYALLRRLRRAKHAIED